jgi:chromosome segregation ATPase
MRVLGLPIEPPQAVINRALSDVGAIAGAARRAPRQLDRLLDLGEEMVGIGRRVLEIAERLDERAEAIMALGERLEARAEAVMQMGDRLDERAQEMLEAATTVEELGKRIDDRGAEIVDRGAEIVDRATRVVETGGELIAVLPAFERALEMATPLEGAIDRFGRLMDRLPGGGAVRRRVDEADPPAPSPTQES